MIGGVAPERNSIKNKISFFEKQVEEQSNTRAPIKKTPAKKIGAIGNIKRTVSNFRKRFSTIVPDTNHSAPSLFNEYKLLVLTWNVAGLIPN